MIQAENLTVRHTSGGAPVLERVTFSVAPGEIVLLAGVNGAGKSSLLLAVAGLLPVSGGLNVGGVDATADPDGVRRTSRLVLQDADLQILGATVEEDLLLCLGRSPTAEDLERARAAADRFHLLEKWEAPVHELSWGQKRRLCLAGAWLAAPRLLLLDEPFAGLDYPGKLEMRTLLRENKAAGLTQIIALHDLEPAADLADSLGVLGAGTLALFGPPAAVLDRVRDFGVRPPCAWTAGRGLAPWESA